MVAVIFRMLDALRIADLIYVPAAKQCTDQDHVATRRRENLFDFDKIRLWRNPPRRYLLPDHCDDHRQHKNGSAGTICRRRTLMSLTRTKNTRSMPSLAAVIMAPWSSRSITRS